MCIDQCLGDRVLYQHMSVLRNDSPYLLYKNAAKAVPNKDQRSSVIL